MPAPWGPVSANTTDGARFWFSFDYGPVHFLLMSTEHDYWYGVACLAMMLLCCFVCFRICVAKFCLFRCSSGSEQYTWMQNDLAQAVANRHTV